MRHLDLVRCICCKQVQYQVSIFRPVASPMFGEVAWTRLRSGSQELAPENFFKRCVFLHSRHIWALFETQIRRNFCTVHGRPTRTLLTCEYINAIFVTHVVEGILNSTFSNLCACNVPVWVMRWRCGQSIALATKRSQV